MPGAEVYKDVAEIRRQSACRRFARIAANEPEHARFSYARSNRRRLSSRQIPRLRLAARPICWILGRRRDRIRHERVPHAGCPFPIARRLAGRRDLSRTVFENESMQRDDTRACFALAIARHSRTTAYDCIAFLHLITVDIRDQELIIRRLFSKYQFLQRY